MSRLIGHLIYVRRPYLVLSDMIITFVIPLILMVIFYSSILLKLRKIGPISRWNRNEKDQKKVTILVLAIISGYLICSGSILFRPNLTPITLHEEEILCY